MNPRLDVFSWYWLVRDKAILSDFAFRRGVTNWDPTYAKATFELESLSRSLATAANHGFMRRYQQSPGGGEGVILKGLCCYHETFFSQLTWFWRKEDNHFHFRKDSLPCTPVPRQWFGACGELWSETNYAPCYEGHYDWLEIIARKVVPWKLTHWWRHGCLLLLRLVLAWIDTKFGTAKAFEGS